MARQHQPHGGSSPMWQPVIGQLLGQWEAARTSNGDVKPMGRSRADPQIMQGVKSSRAHSWEGEGPPETWATEARERGEAYGTHHKNAGLITHTASWGPAHKLSFWFCPSSWIYRPLASHYYRTRTILWHFKLRLDMRGTYRSEDNNHFFFLSTKVILNLFIVILRIKIFK